MKRLSIVMFLLLAGCGVSQEGTTLKIQNYARNICGFWPTASTVIAILAAPNPAVSGIIPVANAICSAVLANPPPSSSSMLSMISSKSECPQVNGVCIDGYWADDSEDKGK